MEFEWDDEKEKINIKKHNISFTVAKKFLMMIIELKSMMKSIV
jgi:uncharacterized DUF497 family protein